MSDDINYVYVKGEGWVPRKEEPEMLPFVPVEYGEELHRAAEIWYSQRTAWARPIRLQVHDEIWYYDDPVTFTYGNHQVPRQIPRGEPREPNRVRYYPGSNTPAETMSVEESPRDRQIREYRERLRKRGRNP